MELLFSCVWCVVVLHTSFPSQEVIKFLTDCGNKNLQHLLVPSRLESALAQMDTDHDGTIDADEWCVLDSATLGRLRRGDGVLVA